MNVEKKRILKYTTLAFLWRFGWTANSKMRPYWCEVIETERGQATRLVSEMGDEAALVKKDHTILLDSVLFLMGHCWNLQRKFDSENLDLNNQITAFMANGGLLAILMRTTAKWYAHYDGKRLAFNQVRDLLQSAAYLLWALAMAYEVALLNFDHSGSWEFEDFMDLRSRRVKLGCCLAQIDDNVKEIAKEVFKVPNSQPSRSLVPCHCLGVFLDFVRANLEALLKSRIEWTNPESGDDAEACRFVLLKYRIKLIASDMDRIALLREDLSFLITFLGDMSLLSPMFDKVKKLDLWNKIEAVANQAGRFCCVLFTDKLNIQMNQILSDLSQEIECMKAEIKNYLVAFQPPTSKTPRTTYENVIGLNDSLLEHLEALQESQTDPIGPVKNLIAVLDKELLSVGYILKLLNNCSTKLEYLKELAEHIAYVIEMAEYIIDSYVVQTTPLWYFETRFAHVIREIELIKKKATEIDHNNQCSRGVEEVPTTDIFQAPTPVLTKVIMNHHHILEKTIKEQLTRDTRGLELISIVGMPGLGKTTLAKKVYDDFTILYRFHVRIWCSVSQAYHRRGLLLDIIGSITNGTYRKSEESSELRVGMSQEYEEGSEHSIGMSHECVKGSELRVGMSQQSMKSSELRVGMSEESEEGYELRDGKYQKSEEDSEINDEKGIRNEEDSKVSNELNDMSDEDLARSLYQLLKGKRYIIVMDDIWDSKPWDDFRVCFPDDNTGSRILFTSRSKELHLQGKHHTTFRHPFLSRNESWYLLRHNVFQNGECPPELEEVGKEIARKCQRLPILVNLVAGLLGRMEKTLSLWEQFSGSLSSYIAKDTNVSERILEQIYKHLPDNLRQCFLYFGGFPKERAISVHKLIQLWVAEGFIFRIGNESLERLAEKCLTDLINRNLVLVVDRRFDGRVKTCRIHALLHDFCSRKAEEAKFLKVINGHFPLYESPQRVAILDPKCPDSMPWLPHVRSLLCLFPYSPNHLFYNTSFLFYSSRLLKVLDLECIRTLGILPSTIGQLVLLKYLAVAGNFTSIPSSIRNLWSLETLIVKSPLNCLPDVILGMPKLRHLQIEVQGTTTSRKTSLYDQRVFLFHAVQTLGTVCIDSLKAEEFLRCFPNLHKLKCSFHAIWEIDSTPHLPVLDFLDHLEVLHIVRIYYEYDMLKDTTSLTLPSSLKQVTLTNCELPWEEISVLGRTLPKLEVLKLLMLATEGDEWDIENDEVEFPELKFLKFENLCIQKWKVAYSHQFPNLRKLVLLDCKELDEIPLSLADTEPLEMIEIQGCSSSVIVSAKEIQERQQGFGNEQFRVLIHASDYSGNDEGFGDRS